jgi:hypothetical protein
MNKRRDNEKRKKIFIADSTPEIVGRSGSPLQLRVKYQIYFACGIALAVGTVRERLHGYVGRSRVTKRTPFHAAAFRLPLGQEWPAHTARVIIQAELAANG